MKTQFIAYALSLSILVTSAAMATPKPTQCPHVKSIAAISDFERIVSSPHGYGWTAYSYGDFNTPYKWEFAITNIHEPTKEEALEQAKIALKTILFSYGPVNADNSGNDDAPWRCLYYAANFTFGVATLQH